MQGVQNQNKKKHRYVCLFTYFRAKKAPLIFFKFKFFYGFLSNVDYSLMKQNIFINTAILF